MKNNVHTTVFFHSGLFQPIKKKIYPCFAGLQWNENDSFLGSIHFIILSFAKKRFQKNKAENSKNKKKNGKFQNVSYGNFVLFEFFKIFSWHNKKGHRWNIWYNTEQCFLWKWNCVLNECIIRILINKK